MATDTQPKPDAKPQAAKGTAVVTGASSGIGEEFARQLDQRGYDLVLVARRRDRLEALAKEIGGAEIIEADLSTPAGVAAVEERIAKGDIEMLVNNAGFATNGGFADLPLARELEEIDLNIRALTQLSHAALGPMKARRSGTIINVASTGAYQPVPYMSTYAATKAYVLSFSEGIHEEAKTYSVTVTCLCPGPVKTEFQAVSGVRAESMPARLGHAAAGREAGPQRREVRQRHRRAGHDQQSHRQPGPHRAPVHGPQNLRPHVQEGVTGG